MHTSLSISNHNPNATAAADIHRRIKQEPAAPSTMMSPNLNAPVAAAAPIKKEPAGQVNVFKTVPRHHDHFQQQHQQWEEQQPQLLKFTNDLFSLAAGICAFKSNFDPLYKNLDSLQRCVDSMVENLNHQLRHPHQTRTQTQTQPDKESAEASEPEPRVERSSEEAEYLMTVKPLRSEIEHLCERMSFRGLRKYVASHLPSSEDAAKFREKVVAALKLAPKPAELVLDCVGKFYLQGSKCYSKDPHLGPLRHARILLLESFLLLLERCSNEGCGIEIKQALKEAAEQGAVVWRKRLIYEGGLDKASEIDARGLLLFIAAFGIPLGFADEDLADLSRGCNMEEIIDLLKGSVPLLAKLPGIIDSMAKNGRYDEAIVFACHFGVEDKFPPRAILTTFLQEAKKRYTNERMQGTNGSTVALKEWKEKQLAALKSVVKFVEDHGWDLEKLCAGWEVKEKIANLEKEIANIFLGNTPSIGYRRAMPKRKLDESSKESRRSRVTVARPPLVKSPGVNGGLDEKQHEVAPPRSSHKGTFLGSSYTSVSALPNADAAPAVDTHPAGVPIRKNEVGCLKQVSESHVTVTSPRLVKSPGVKGGLDEQQHEVVTVADGRPRSSHKGTFLGSSYASVSALPDADAAPVVYTHPGGAQKRKLNEVGCLKQVSEESRSTPVTVTCPPLVKSPGVNRGLDEQQHEVAPPRSSHKGTFLGSSYTSVSALPNADAAPVANTHPAVVQKRKLNEVRCLKQVSEESRSTCVAVTSPPLMKSPGVNGGLDEQQHEVSPPRSSHKVTFPGSSYTSVSPLPNADATPVVDTHPGGVQKRKLNEVGCLKQVSEESRSTRVTVTSPRLVKYPGVNGGLDEKQDEVAPPRSSHKGTFLGGSYTSVSALPNADAAPVADTHPAGVLKRKLNEVGCLKQVSEESRSTRVTVTSPSLVKSPGVNGGLDEKQDEVAPPRSSHKGTFLGGSYTSVSALPNADAAPVADTHPAGVLKRRLNEVGCLKQVSKESRSTRITVTSPPLMKSPGVNGGLDEQQHEVAPPRSSHKGTFLGSSYTSVSASALPNADAAPVADTHPAGLPKRELDEVGCLKRVSESRASVTSPPLLKSPGVMGGLDEQQHEVVTVADVPPRSSHKGTFLGSSYTSGSALPNADAAPVVATHPASVGKDEARPHSENRADVVPRVMDGQGHGLECERHGQGSVGAKSYPERPAYVVAVPNGYYFPSQRSGSSQHVSLIPDLYSFVDQVKEDREESKDEDSGCAVPCALAHSYQSC